MLYLVVLVTLITCHDVSDLTREDDKEADDSEQAMQEAAAAYEGLGKMDYRVALVKFYEEHNPEKLADVDKVMAKWEGREHHMLVALQEKYNRELVVAPPEIEL